jgi:hemerythrin
MDMYFEWKDAYELSVEEIDEQHKKLFGIGKRVSDLIQNQDVLSDFGAVQQILIELKEHTEEHFIKEEQFMQEHGYHDIQTHAMEHNFLRKKLLKIDNLAEPNHEMVVRLVSFVADWISQHILISDMKIKKHLLYVEKNTGV